MSLIKNLLKGTPSNMIELLAGLERDDTIIAKMPNSPYSFMCVENPKGSWTVDLMDPETDKKETIYKCMSKDKFKLFLYGLYGIQSKIYVKKK